MNFELRIAVCDAKEYSRDRIKEIIEECLAVRHVLGSIDLFPGGRTFCQDKNNFSQYDIIFLDLDKMNGLETAYAIRDGNKEVDIVLVSGTTEYVFEGYKVGAVRYIMKNNMEQLLPECINALLQKKCRINKCRKFDFVGGSREISLRDILYIESQLHKLCFTKLDEKLYIYEKIDNIESEIRHFDFVRTHQSFLVNLEHVEKIGSYIVHLSDGTRIPVVKRRYQEVKNQYLRYKEGRTGFE